MTREIKFRAWDKDSGVMYYSDKDEDNGEGFILWNIDSGGIYFTENQMWHEIEGGEDSGEKWDYRKPNQDLMQFTGLKDKNGKEIYEGDIVKFIDTEFGGEAFLATNAEGIVSYKDGCFGIDIKDYHLLLPLRKIEVIGNIYENPELLKGDKI